MKALSVVFLFSLSTTSLTANAGPLPERVETAAQERIAADSYQTLVFGVVDGDKTEIVTFGKLDNGNAPDGDTVFEIGSITKTFTATLLAQAVLAGRVTLDTSVSQLLPDFKIPLRGGMEITLGELGTQHSALPRMPTNILPKDPANPYADYDAAKLKAFLADYQLLRDPGAAYEYSNLGFGLLGVRAGAVRAHNLWRHDRRKDSQAAWDDDERHGAQRRHEHPSCTRSRQHRQRDEELGLRRPGGGGRDPFHRQ